MKQKKISFQGNIGGQNINSEYFGVKLLKKKLESVEKYNKKNS